MINRLKEVGYALVSTGKGLGITLKNLFRRNVTIQYPEVKPKVSERFRGKLDFNIDTCIACGLCVKACPSNVLTLESGPPTPGKKGRTVETYNMDLGRCVFCGLCVEACPTDALRMLPEYAYSGRSREFLQYDKERLRAEHIARFGETPPPADKTADEAPKPAAEAKPAAAPALGESKPVEAPKPDGAKPDGAEPEEAEAPAEESKVE